MALHVVVQFSKDAVESSEASMHIVTKKKKDKIRLDMGTFMTRFLN